MIQFPVFIQPYIQKPLTLYQLETVPVPILDTNIDTQSCTHLHVRSCKKLGDEFYCKELFIVKHKSSYNCESTIYFNLSTDIIRNNCNFDFYYSKTDVTSYSFGWRR